MKKAKKAPETVAAKKPAGSQRRSSRLAKKLEDETEAAENEAAVLSQFIIGGDCPKCSRVVQKGHKKHLASCEGEPEVPKLSPQELKEQVIGCFSRRCFPSV